MTNAELQVEIKKLNDKNLVLREDINNNLAVSRDAYAAQAQTLIDNFPYDFGGNDCWGADKLGPATGYVQSNSNVSAQFCSNGRGCSKTDCERYINAQINPNIDEARRIQELINSRENEIKSNNAEIAILTGELSDSPETQALVGAAAASAAAVADAAKKKWIIFGIIVLVIVIGAIIIYIRVRK